MEAENWRGKVYGIETSGLSAVNAKFLQQSNNVFRGQKNLARYRFHPLYLCIYYLKDIARARLELSTNLNLALLMGAERGPENQQNTQNVLMDYIKTPRQLLRG